MLVVEQDGDIFGYSHFSNGGQLLALYLDRRIMDQGIGGKLLQRVEDHARSKGITTIELESTRNAVRFYAHHGFVQTAPEHTTVIGGEPIPSVPMKKVLTHNSPGGMSPP